MLLSPGMSVDRYVAERLLRAEGDAEVWAVRHSLLGSQHALKVLAQRAPSAQVETLRVARAHARLDHPNLMPVRDVFTINGRAALLMPALDGPTLRALMDARAMTSEEVIPMLIALAGGLKFAHSHGFVHHQLCPENVSLRIEHGQLSPRLLNFELLPAHGSDRRDGYQAPEPLRGPAADWYALGVLMVEMLSGQPPSRPPNLNGLSAHERAIAEAMLHPDPDHRLQGDDALQRLIRLRSGDETVPALLHAVERLHVQRSRIDAEQRTAFTFDAENIDHSQDTVRHNLAAPRSSFIGRDADLSALHDLLDQDQRLVTILGTGGIGKSRLSTELGHRLLGRWSGGVWFCELTDAQTPGALMSAIASALSIRLGDAPDAQLSAAIAGRGPALFILDNFEQLVDFAPQTVARWLDDAPDARFLVTSREPLRLRGEHTYTLDTLNEADASALFFARAADAGAPLQDQRAHLDDVAALVQLLDRLPLAIELAAARFRTYSPRQLLQRMNQRFRLLRTRSTDLPARQRTLWATFEWSWERLRPEEQDALQQCCVFEGGMTVADAEAVIQLEASVFVDDVLAELIDRGLLIRAQGRRGQPVRLRMLLSIQQFVQKKRGNNVDAALRHGRHFAQRGTLAAMNLIRGHRGLERSLDLLDECSNLEAAARRALDRGDVVIAARCAVAAAHGFNRTGPIGEGIDLLDQIAEQDDALPVDLKMLVLVTRGQLGAHAGRPDTIAITRATVAMARANNALTILCEGLGLLGRALLSSGAIEEAQDVLAEAVTVATAANDAFRAGTIQLSLHELNLHRGDINAAEEHLSRAINIAEETGDIALKNRCDSLLANQLRRQGHHERAEVVYRRTLATAKAMRDQHSESVVLSNLAILHFRSGRLDACEAAFERSAQLARRLGDQIGESVTIGNLGELYLIQGKIAEGRQAIERARSLARAIGKVSAEIRCLIRLGNLLTDEGRYAEAQALFIEGLDKAQESRDRQSQISLVGSLGDIHLKQGDLDRAEAMNLEALRIAEATDDSYLIGHRHSNLAMFYFHVARYQDAMASLERSSVYVEKNDDVDMRSVHLGRKAHILYALGRLDEAYENICGALDAVAQVGDTKSEVFWRRMMGTILGELGRRDEAEAMLQHARRLAQEREDQKTAAECLYNLSNARLLHGDISGAATAIEEAMREVWEIEDFVLRCVCLETRARIRRLRGDLDGAAEDLTDAQTLLEQVTNPLSAIRIWTGWLEVHLLRDAIGPAREALRKAHAVLDVSQFPDSNPMVVRIREVDAQLG
ncbi:MAG: tetratricopeptide repeat protein [Myxococcota bacterium]